MKECNKCGKCCIKYGDGALSASPKEIELWAIFRPEIYEYVRNDEIWFDPQSGKKLKVCPFLEIEPNSKSTAQKKYTCAIYLDRPEDCRYYPTNISEMVRDECEMIEAVDLTNTKKAQQTLDKLMSDSRPASHF